MVFHFTAPFEEYGKGPITMYPERSLPLSTVVFTIGRPDTPGRDMAGEAFDSPEDYGILVPRMDGSDVLANIPSTASAAGSIVLDKCPSRIFAAAYLLTGSARQAEMAMLENTQRLEINATPCACPPWKAIIAAIMRRYRNSTETPDEESTMFPIELRRALRLSPGLRQCFVLRVLMAMPRQYCAELLGIDAEEVDTNSELATHKLVTFMTA